MKKIFLFIGIFAMLSVLTLKAQVTIGANQEPDPSAVLDLQSKGNLGLLLPRVALTDTLRTGSANPVANVKGMFVYNTNASVDGQVVEGIYYNDGNRWWPATGGGAAGPWDISGSTDAARLNSQDIYQIGSVTIGMDTLQPVTMLNVISDNKGIMIPRMTLDQRNAIDTTNANSLMIYNTDEDCYNYYSKSIGDWQSLCGGMPKAVFTVGSCDSITVNGAYIEGVPLNGSNYLAIKVDVTKAGNYTFTATTTNGYGFTGSGTILDAPAKLVLMIPGQGTPKVQNQTPGDLVSFSSSGGAVNCDNLTIPVLPSVATYDMTCGSIKATGAYIKNVQLDGSNTITLQVNVTDISSGGSWTIRTNVNNGISFLGSGVFTSEGAQSVTLYGTGTPNTTDPIPLTLTANSGGGESTCNTTIQIAYPKMTVLTLGGPDTYGYNMAVTTSAVYGMMTKQNNFGTAANSTVKSQGFTWANGAVETGTALQNDLQGKGTHCATFPPDIVVMGYPWTAPAGDVAGQALLDYLQAGGVVLMYCEDAPTVQAVMRIIFGDNTITDSRPGGDTPGSRYQIPISNDPVINGPFGNIGGKYWGEDASNTVELANMTGKPMTFYTVGASGGITAFKHSSLNLLWTGDGGFNSNNQGTDPNICPFRVQDLTNYVPVVRTGYGENADFNGTGDVYNSIFTANAMAWALQAAMTNGINALNR